MLRLCFTKHVLRLCFTKHVLRLCFAKERPPLRANLGPGGEGPGNRGAARHAA